MKVILESNIKHLGLIPEFKAKVVRAYENKQGETFRVHWKPYGWIRFVLNAKGNYIGYLEESGLQTALTELPRKKKSELDMAANRQDFRNQGKTGGKAGFRDGGSCVSRILDEKRPFKNGKLGIAQPQQPPKQSCPECGSARIWKDGFHYRVNGKPIQRFLCRNCGYRFSYKKQLTKQKLKKGYTLPSKSQVCAALTRGAKNLAPAETQTRAKRESTETTQDVKGLIVQFMAYLEKEGYGRQSRYPNNLKTLVNLGADLLNPESVKTVIGKHNIKNGAKLQYVYAYSAFLKMLKLSWNPPKYKQEETLPFIPDESELDQLIASCRSRRMATYLQCLKETYADPGEVLKLRWIDVSGNIITINKPVKGHLPRQIEVSNRLISMLNSLPKIDERIFPTTYQVMFSCYNKVRKRAAELQKNPRLLSIQFRTFRHWGGTMIAHYTNGNVLTVKKLLGHKRIENTMKYIGMIHFKDDEFEVTTATTIDEAKKVLSAGFNYVTEKNGIMLFRRPKRFSKYVS